MTPVPTSRPLTLRQTVRRGFWRWLCRLAYRRLCAGVPTRVAPVGLPLMRDPDHRCHGYEPRPWQGGDFRDCQSDGHYLCLQCCHLDPSSERAADGGDR